MVKKLLWNIFYFSVFCLLALTIYRLACYVPPAPEEEGYRLYRLGAACVAVLVSGTAVGGLLILDYMGEEDEEEKKHGKR